MSLRVTEGNINEFGRLDALKVTADRAKSKEMLEKLTKFPIPMHRVMMKLDTLLREFILRGGFDME